MESFNEEDFVLDTDPPRKPPTLDELFEFEFPVQVTEKFSQWFKDENLLKQIDKNDFKKND